MQHKIKVVEPKKLPEIHPLISDTKLKGRPRVFVYGTLKRGHPNNALLHGADYVGADTITGPLQMLSLGGCPGVVEDAKKVAGANTIFGEVYAVDDKILAALDVLENHPNWYERTKYRTDYMNARVWMYTLPPDWLARKEYPVVDDGVWKPRAVEVNLWKSLGVFEHVSKS